MLMFLRQNVETSSLHEGSHTFQNASLLETSNMNAEHAVVHDTENVQHQKPMKNKLVTLYAVVHET